MWKLFSNNLKWRQQQQQQQNTKLILRLKLQYMKTKRIILFILEWYFNSGTKKKQPVVWIIFKQTIFWTIFIEQNHKK